MKNDIHPNWNHTALVTCSCGNTFTTGSMQDTLNVDICSACHPFFTGEMKFVDRQGRVDKFMQKMQTAQSKQQAMVSKKKKTKGSSDKQEKFQSYKQLLQQQKQAISAVKAVAEQKPEVSK
jgi:large subunit ribosomal protein L31